jgi:hypothetical protein
MGYCGLTKRGLPVDDIHGPELLISIQTTSRTQNIIIAATGGISKARGFEIGKDGDGHELEKNGIPLVFLRSTKGRKDGCFGAVFMDIHKDRDLFGRKIGGIYLLKLTGSILSRLFMVY